MSCSTIVFGGGLTSSTITVDYLTSTSNNVPSTTVTVNGGCTLVEASTGLNSALSVSEYTSLLSVNAGSPTTILTSATVGPPGAPGATATITGTAVAAVDLSAGVPVYLSRSNGQLYPASSNTSVSSMVVGFMLETVPAGFVGTYDREAITLMDWTAITGATSLLTGQTYFLAGNGTLSLLTPTVGTNTRVGVALTPTTLGINPSIFPIML
jgi:hypothetical protein